MNKITIFIAMILLANVSMAQPAPDGGALSYVFAKLGSMNCNGDMLCGEEGLADVLANEFEMGEEAGELCEGDYGLGYWYSTALDECLMGCEDEACGVTCANEAHAEFTRVANEMRMMYVYAVFMTCYDEEPGCFEYYFGIYQDIHEDIMMCIAEGEFRPPTSV